MKTRHFTLAVATGMALALSALAADPYGVSGTDTHRQSKQQARPSARAPAPQAMQPEQTAGLGSSVSDADFDRQTMSISHSLQRGELTIATESAPASRAPGAAGSPGQFLGRGGQLTDSGSAWFDSYVDQVNRQLQRSEPAFR